ncbi:MAG: hypothetical protein RBT65_14220, partial [Methanolobus sp.]|nr:hypothetical protein [Methanolobus sp.]
IDFKPGLDQVLLKNKDDDIYQIFIVDLNLADTNHTEWESGIEVIKKIKACISDPVILVYSQFLNPSFRLKKHQKDLNDSEDQLNYPLIIGNFLKYYMNFADENLIPKSLNNDIIMNEETPVEINDLPLLTYRLSYVLANRVLTN